MISAPVRQKSEFLPQVNLTLARRIKEAALAVEGVVDIGRGWLAEVTTLEEKVLGVAVEQDSVEVHMVAEYPVGFPIAALDERLRSALQPLAVGRRLDIVVDDLAVVRSDATG